RGLLHSRGVRQTGDVEDCGGKVHVGAGRAELKRFQVVVTPALFEVVPVGATLSHVELHVPDAPRVNPSGEVRVGQTDDVEAGIAECPGHIDVRPRQFLLDLDVAGREPLTELDVRDDMDVGATLLSWRVLPGRAGSSERERGNR